MRADEQIPLELRHSFLWRRKNFYNPWDTIVLSLIFLRLTCIKLKCWARLTVDINVGHELSPYIQKLIKTEQRLWIALVLTCFDNICIISTKKILTSIHINRWNVCISYVFNVNTSILIMKHKGSQPHTEISKALTLTDEERLLQTYKKL